MEKLIISFLCSEKYTYCTFQISALRYISAYQRGSQTEHKDYHLVSSCYLYLQSFRFKNSFKIFYNWNQNLHNQTTCYFFLGFTFLDRLLSYYIILNVILSHCSQLKISVTLKVSNCYAYECRRCLLGVINYKKNIYATRNFCINLNVY